MHNNGDQNSHGSPNGSEDRFSQPLVLEPDATSVEDFSDTDAGFQEAWGSHLRSKKTYITVKPRNAKLEISRPFIMAMAHGAQADGAERVRSHHSSMFLEQRGGDLTVLREVASDIDGNIKGIKRHVDDLSRRLDGTKRYNDSHIEGHAWSLLDRIVFGCFVVFGFAMLAVGLNNMGILLSNSGIKEFQNFWRAVFFSLILIGVPFSLKALGRLIISLNLKRLYIASVCAIGLVLGILWAYLCATNFAGALQTTDLLGSLDDAHSAGANTSPALMFFGMIAEAFLAAGCWLIAEMIHDGHGRSQRGHNPQFTRTQKDLSSWKRLQREERELLGHARARILEIEEGMKVFVNEAYAFFEWQRSSATMFFGK